MPAVVRCPNGCKLRVPIRKLSEAIHCPKCSGSFLITATQIEKHKEDPSSVLEGSHTTGVTSEQKTKNQSATVPPKPNPRVLPLPPLAPPIPVTSDHRSPDQSQHSKNLCDEPESQGQPRTALQRVDETLQDEETKIEELEQRLSEEQAKRESIANRSVKLFSRWLTDEENPGTFQNAENCWKAYALSWALVIIGIFLLGPVIYTMLGWIGKDYHLPLGRWSLLLVFLSAFQFLYAVFLFQIPDWTTTRLVSYLMLAMTVFSTCLLAITLLSQENSSFFKYLQLSIVDKGKISSWLTVMSIGFGMMSYLCGRTTQQWMKEESRRRLPVQSTLV